jgi:hypothetical protein
MGVIGTAEPINLRDLEFRMDVERVHRKVLEADLVQA